MMKLMMMTAILFVGANVMVAQENNSKNETSDDKTKTEFKVYGNCGMCENRIEKATKGIDGVYSADWDKVTKMIVVEFNPSKVKVITLHETIAEAGHDTEKATAEDKVYNALPGCCKYDRESKKESGSE